MTSGESIGTEQFRGLTVIDGLRWGLAAVVVVAAGSVGLWIARDWTPPAVAPGIAEPVVLLDLAPLPPPPEAMPPEITTPPEPVEPPPEPEPAPPPPEPVVEPPVVTPPMVDPPEPVVEPEPIIEEPQPVEPPPEPEPAPEIPELAEPAVAMPVTMSADLRQQRLETPATVVRKPRVEPPAERAPAPEPTAPQPVVASGPSPAEWQAQVLRHLDRRKVYPREAQRAGQEGVVQIAFTIDAAGRVLAVSVSRSSGIAALDQAALETARRASPVPRPPASVGQGNIALSAAIRFTIR